MYAIFAKNLLTDKGKLLVREHGDYYDAQIIHTKLYDYSQCSAKVYVDASDLLSYITTSRLGTRVWKGSTE